jgi:hypothetical protein
MEDDIRCIVIQCHIVNDVFECLAKMNASEHFLRRGPKVYKPYFHLCSFKKRAQNFLEFETRIKDGS